MLIFPKGYKEFQDKCEKFEAKGTWSGDKSTLKERGGWKVTEEMDKHHEAAMNRVVWLLPWWFCVDCGRTNITQDQVADHGIFMFPEPRPEIDMKPNEVLHYKRCRSCVDESLFGTGPKLVYPDGIWQRNQMTQQERIERNVVEYVKAMKLKGEEPFESI